MRKATTQQRSDGEIPPLKVAQLLYSGLGGHGSVAFSLIAGDAEHRWSNALCFIGIEPLLPAYETRCRQLDIPYVYAAVRAGRPWQSWGKVRRWLDDEGPDALIVHSTAVLPPCVTYARRHRIPLIMVEHQAVALKRRRDWLLTVIAMTFADRIVMLTPAFAEAMRKRIGPFYRKRKAAIVPNGVDLELFAPATPRPDGPFRIGMAARFTGSKRHDLLIEIVRRLKQRAPAVAWQLTFAGAGETQDRMRLLAAELGDSVAFEGNLDEAKLADWYRSLRLYALASDGEAFSTSIVQAMASGLPVIASDVIGIRSQVTDEFGSLLPNGDPDSWMEAIISQLKDTELANVRGRRARRICEELYSAKAMHEAYDELIRDAAQRR
jgi:glycosyltransferase involved in cell wall biosynthesis